MSAVLAASEERDPFALTANPAAYVPTPPLERALAQLLSALDAGRVPVLSGPTGLGKTLLLKLASQRVGDRFVPLYVPYATLAPQDLARLTLGLLERDTTDDPVTRLLEVARELADAERPLLLLIDDAGTLPRETAEALAHWLRESGGALHLALAGLPGESLRTATRAVEASAVQIHLEEGLPREQLPDYVSARLSVAGVEPHVREAFDDAALDELARVCQGNPRKLHLAAQAIVRSARSASAGKGAAQAAGSPGAGPAAERREGAARPAPGVAQEPYDVGAYRFVRGRLVDPRTGEPAAADEAVPVAEVLRGERPAPAREHPGSDGREPIAPEAGFSLEDDLESFDPGDDADWTRSLAGSASLEAEAAGAPAPTREAGAGDARPHGAGADAGRTPARGTHPPRRWPGWVAAAVAGMAFGVGLATQLDVLRPEPPLTVAPETRPPEPEARPAEAQPAPSEASPVAGREAETAGEGAATAARPGTAREAVETPEPVERVAEGGSEEAGAASETAALEEAAVPESSAAEVPTEATDAGEETAAAESPLADGGAAPASPSAEAGVEEPAAEAEAPAERAPATPPEPVETVAVAINATPWAVIEIDGEEVGETPLAGIELPVGRHRFVARMPDGSTRERVLRIDAEQRTVVFE